MSTIDQAYITNFFNGLDLSHRGRASQKIHEELARYLKDHKFEFGVRNDNQNKFFLKIFQNYSNKMYAYLLCKI